MSIKCSSKIIVYVLANIVLSYTGPVHGWQLTEMSRRLIGAVWFSRVSSETQSYLKLLDELISSKDLLCFNRVFTRLGELPLPEK